MANSTAISFTLSKDTFLCSIVFKFVAMIIGVFGNVTVIIHTIFLSKEKTATSYLVGNLALADPLVCLTFYPIWIIEFIQNVLDIESDQDLFCKLSRSTLRTFMFASATTLVAITVDRYLYFAKPLKYPLIVTRRRVFLAVSGIWLTACSLFIFIYAQVSGFGKVFYRSLCVMPLFHSYFVPSFVGYIPLIFIFFLNIKIFLVARKQRKRILAERKTASVNNCNEHLAKRMKTRVRQFFVALKAAKTFAVVFVVLTFCILIPAVVSKVLPYFCIDIGSCKIIWTVFFYFEFYGINSIVNVFIYGMRHVKYRKAYLNILYCNKSRKR